MALASVVPPLTPVLVALSREYLGQDPLVIEPGVKTGMPILYEPPGDVGADRIVNGVAAFAAYGGPVIVVDFGTATTFDVVTRKGEYVGGVICTGVGHQRGRALPARGPPAARRHPPPGQGHRPLDRGLHPVRPVLRIRGRWWKASSRASAPSWASRRGRWPRAGWPQTLAADLPSIEAVDPVLTLTGLRLIWERNRSPAGDERPAGPSARRPIRRRAYYQTIEEFFVSRRGDPLFLSNADWLLIRRWRKAGMPLRVVLRGIADALDGHAHSWGRHRKVGSLAYCAAEVDVARERWQRALALGEEPGAGPAAALAAFADALDGRAAWTADAARRTRRAWPRELRGWAARSAAACARSSRCSPARGGAARAPARRDGRAPTLAEIEARGSDADLAPYAGAHAGARCWPRSATRPGRARLLARHGIPRLSLFHL